MIINSLEQIVALRDAVAKNAETSYATIQKCVSAMNPIQFFAAIKFDKLGSDPIGGDTQNLIEQINQMYSDMVVLAAAEELLGRYPGTNLKLNLGAYSGYDIQSDDGTIVAECFSVTTVSSNRKLAKDCQKLMRSDAPIKYVYFYSHLDSDEKLQKQYCKYPDICFRRIFLNF